ncbi:MAG: hypothetical protein AAF738_03530 [Bacteroidota bacterium]
MKPSIELIRCVAVVLITFTHTRHDLEENDVLYFIIEVLPSFGTVILSIVSGYLYYRVSRHKQGLFQRKIRSLAIPYVIANLAVLAAVLVLYIVFGYNVLNRLDYDIHLILEGVFALNSPPINPPTYFIRDIFVVFLVLALVTERDLRTLFILLPLLFFGTFLLRWDILFLFLGGVAYAKYEAQLPKILLMVVTLLVSSVLILYAPVYLKYAVAVFLFLLLIDLKFQFPNTGKYTYLLHLYHSPIIVISFPIWSKCLSDVKLLLFAQVSTALIASYILFLLAKRYAPIDVISGGR